MGKLNKQALCTFGLQKERLPRHVAIIMDGNGRWARAQGLPRTFGHRAGTERLREIIRFTDNVGIEALTLYAFSTENWKRPSDEKTVLFGLLIEYFTHEIEELHANGVRISIWGDKGLFPINVQDALKAAEARTKDNTGLKLNICLNYGSRQEILKAVQDCAREAILTKQVPTELDFSNKLYSKDTPEVDLLIRSSGEQRLSNFLLYQLAYAELYFTQVYWPDFTQEEYIKALSSFENRARRFGGL